MDKLQHLTFGCSHTRGHYLSQNERWMSIANQMDKRLDFHNFGVNSAGLAFMFHLAKSLTNAYIPPDRVTHVVLQKPDPTRMVWWRNEHPVSEHSSNKLILYKIRKRCNKTFSRLIGTQSDDAAAKILDFEIEILKWFKGLFPNAKFAYYFYWADEIMGGVRWPSISEHYKKLGVASEKLGMSNLGSIIDAKEIPGVYNEDGDVLWDLKKIHSEGWAVLPNDPHPSRKHQIEVAKKIVNWF